MSPVHVPFATILAAAPPWEWLQGTYVRFREKATPEMRGRGEQHRWMFGTLVSVQAPRTLDVEGEDVQVGRTFILGHIERTDPNNPRNRLDPEREAVPFLEEEIDIVPELDFPGTFGAVVQMLTRGGWSFARTVRPSAGDGDRATIAWKGWHADAGTSKDALVGRGHTDGLAVAVLLAKCWNLDADAKEPAE